MLEFRFNSHERAYQVIGALACWFFLEIASSPYSVFSKLLISFSLLNVECFLVPCFRLHHLCLFLSIMYSPFSFYLFFLTKPQDWHGIISSSLGGVMLLGSSTLIAIALVIDAELEPRKSPTAGLSSGMRGAIGLSWFMPALYAILTLLIYTIMGEWPSTWWMTVNTIGFVLFVIIEILFVILFSLLLYTLLHKLHFRAKKHDKHRYLTAKR